MVSFFRRFHHVSDSFDFEIRITYAVQSWDLPREFIYFLYHFKRYIR